MMNTISYENYLDKVKGCFLGKTVIGTLGAPYEGVKMPMELKFRQEMVDTMLPNDDLDLQVIWLDVVEKYGPDFTSEQLLKRFVESCTYSPGEYAIMRKNFQKGIMPPVSGSFCNDYYIEGNGCPIRSEIWACLAPGDPALAAEYSSKDGILDHKGESVIEERFFAGIEAAAFFESDIKKLIKEGLRVIPEKCKTRDLINDAVKYAEETTNIKEALTRLLFKYGHPDCTNSIQNMGITILSLLYGEGDILKTGMLALNCGFDTDCTCASAGALLGIIHGQKKIEEKYGWKGIKYVLGVNIPRRSDLVDDLAEDVARLGSFIGTPLTVITGKPDVRFDFVKSSDIVFETDYENDMPCFGLFKSCHVEVTITDKTGDSIYPEKVSVLSPEHAIAANVFKAVSVEEPSVCVLAFDAKLPDGEDTVYERNIFTVVYKKDGNEFKQTIGVSGNKIWKLTGPLWRTKPATDENVLGEKIGYWQIFSAFSSEREMIDCVRKFHLNFDSDMDIPEISENELFKTLHGDYGFGTESSDLIAKPYYETYVETAQDSFELKDFMGFKGPCVCYLSQILISKEDCTVCAQLGASSPAKLFINGELIGSNDKFDNWTGENVHFDGIKLNKGENRVVLRLTRGNADAKFSLVFSEGLTCATHYCDFATKKI